MISPKIKAVATTARLGNTNEGSRHAIDESTTSAGASVGTGFGIVSKILPNVFQSIG